MAQGQFYPGAIFKTAPEVIDVAPLQFNQGIAALGSLPAAAAANASGTAATVTQLAGGDFAGSFLLTTSTGGGIGSAGSAATVAFNQQQYNKPSSVIVHVADEGSPGGVAAGASSLSISGFTIVTAALTASHTYRVNYWVFQ